jgi:restriction endonuclease S subunit
MRDGWTETTLGEVVEASWGNTTVTKKQYKETGFTAFSASGPDGFVDWFEHEGDGVVLSAIGALCGKTWLAEGKWTPIKNTIWIKSKTEECLTSYLFLISKTTDLWPIRGQAQPFISLGDVRLVEISLPPRDEQKRIVDVVSSVDAYIDALQQQANTARTARNAVLHELLSAGGDDWTETTLGEVLSIQSGFAFSTNDWAAEGYPVIKINNVRDGKVSTESCSYISDPIPQGAEKFLLKRGDLLITLTGEIGATGTVDQTFPMYLNQRVGKVTVRNKSISLLSFAAVLFSFPLIRAEMWSLGKGNAQLNISPKSIHEIVVNLPPIEEQKRIVEIVSSMDEVVQATEQAVTDTKNLRSGLLSDLLSGEHEIPASYDVFVGAA